MLAHQHRLYAAFALYSFTMGSIYPRLPEIKDAMNIEEGALGLALTGAPIGTFIALAFASPVIEKLGFKRTLQISIPLTALCYALAVLTLNPVSFFLLLIPAGLAIGCLEILVNAEADRTEALLERRLMNRAHSFWSFGFFAAGLTGATFAHLGVSPQWHLAIVVVASVPAVWFFLGDFEPAPRRAGEETHTSRFAAPNKPILILALVTLPAMLMEGAGLDWSAIYMDTIFASEAFIAGIAVAVFTLSQAIARYFADSYVDKYSPLIVGQALMLLLTIGIALLFFPATESLSLLGFAVLGVGTSVLFPLAISAAARRTDRAATVNVAALAQISFIAFLVAPPLLGFVAEHFGAHWVYGFGVPFVLLSLYYISALQVDDN